MYKAYQSTIERKNLRRWHKIGRLDALPFKEIAKLTGYTENQVRRTVESPYYQEWKTTKLRPGVSIFDRELSEDTEEMRAELRELVPVAIKRLEAALHSENDSIALRAAVEVLDRDERFNKGQSIAVTHKHEISAADLNRAREIARQLRSKETAILDVAPKALPPAEGT